jgi:hypothetical protein
MKTLDLDVPLTGEECEALCAVARGRKVDAAVLERLIIHGLLRRYNFVVLTTEGHDILRRIVKGS